MGFSKTELSYILDQEMKIYLDEYTLEELKRVIMSKR